MVWLLVNDNLLFPSDTWRGIQCQSDWLPLRGIDTRTFLASVVIRLDLGKRQRDNCPFSSTYCPKGEIHT